jgi:hypothetical protein
MSEYAPVIISVIGCALCVLVIVATAIVGVIRR